MSTQQIIISASQEQVDILLAELGEINFNIFEDSDLGLVAYCQTDLFDLSLFSEIIKKYEILGPISFHINEIEKQNWNAVWESNYDPIRISDKVFIRANFHQSEPGYAMEIVINPKMSFGTGHHETTFLMTKALFELEVHKKSVLDAGTGTGILALVAQKLGAIDVKGFDIDPWSIENSMENAFLNQCKDIVFVEGTIEGEPIKKYDILLANINRNILLAEMHEYSTRVVGGGFLLLSGFYAEDVWMIAKSALENGLICVSQTEKNRWTCLKFQKSNL